MNILTNSLTKGMWRDAPARFQPPNTYYGAFNATVESDEGNVIGLSTEEGFEYWVENLPITKKIVGALLLDDGTFVLFVYDKGVRENQPEIGIYDPQTKQYQTYIRGECLNFSLAHPVRAVAVYEGCDRIIYFTDNYNPFRAVRLGARHLYTGSKDSDIVVNCNRLSYSPEFIIPKEVTITTIDAGGNLKEGAYSAAIRFEMWDGSYTPFFHLTRFVPVRKNASVVIRVKEPDGSFKAVQAAIIAATGENPSSYEVSLLSSVEIDGSIFQTITYSTPGQAIAELSLDEVLVGQYPLYRAKSLTVKDNRLIVGNISELQQNYLGYQRHASSIKVEWVRKLTDCAYLEEKDTYTVNATFEHDEVYALGIVYVHKDGSFSPVFHIPGRGVITDPVGTLPVNPSDYNIYATAIPTGFDNAVIPLTNEDNVFGNPTKAWKVYNTYIKYQDVDEGLLGYYEVDALYPLIPNCDDHPDGYYGRDWQGNLIQGGVTKIRHHRMPPHYGDNEPEALCPIGLRFTFTQPYPNENIIAHFFVHADTTGNKTIIDKGFLLPLLDRTEDAWVFSPLGGDPLEPFTHLYQNTIINPPNDDFRKLVFGYTSPRVLSSRGDFTADYLVIERVWPLFNLPQDFKPTRVKGSSFDGFDTTYDNNTFRVDVDAAVRLFSNYTPPLQAFHGINYKIKTVEFIEASPHTGPVTAQTSVEEPFRIIRNVSMNTPKMVIHLQSTPRLLNNIDLIYEDHSYITRNFYAQMLRGSAVSVALKRLSDVYTDLNALSYVRIDDYYYQALNVPEGNTVFGGDTFYGLFTQIDWAFLGVKSGSTLKVEAKVLQFMAALEMRLNATALKDFRHAYPTQLITTFSGPPTLQKEGLGFAVSRANVHSKRIEDSPTLHPLEHIIEEKFSNLVSLQRFYPYKPSTLTCAECEGYFPHRVMFSLDTNTRVILALNYVDLSLVEGEINALAVIKNKLYAFCTRALYAIPSGQRVLNVADSQVVLSDREYLIPPASPLKVSALSSGGLQHTMGIVETPNGIVWVDELSRKVFLLTDSFEDISQIGMRNFFQENLALEFTREFLVRYGQEYPYVATTHPEGVGFFLTYDPRHARVLIHKRDYRFRYAGNDLLFDGEKFTLNGNKVSLNDTAIFEPLTFTISFSFLNRAWVSFHGYRFEYAFFDEKHFFSNNLFRHGEADALNNFIIDVIFATGTPNNATFVNLLSPTLFPLAMAYNDKQCSSILTATENMMPYSPQPGQIQVKYVDGLWRYNDFRDTVIDPSLPIFSQTLTHHRPNTANNDPFMSPLKQVRLKSPYFGVMLQANPSTPANLPTKRLHVPFLSLTYTLNAR